ncbi:MAG: hypothetical protein F6K48_19075 [Okeania sp. SIO3H1]|nr:hypothetical protein [Okeania sp. SIO3H1]
MYFILIFSPGNELALRPWRGRQETTHPRAPPNPPLAPPPTVEGRGRQPTPNPSQEGKNRE